MNSETRLRAVEDAIAIQNLKSYYFDACDGGWNRPSHEVEKIVACFVEEGCWESNVMGRVQGQAALRAFFANANLDMPFVYHGASNQRIEVSGDEAQGQWHLNFIGSTKDGSEIWARGVYNDVFVRTGAGWKIKEARVTIVFVGPREKGWTELMKQLQS